MMDKYISKERLVSFGVGFVVGMFWFQFTGFFGGLFS